MFCTIVVQGRSVRVPINVNVRATFGQNCTLCCPKSKEVVELNEDGTTVTALKPNSVYELLCCNHSDNNNQSSQSSAAAMETSHGSAFGTTSMIPIGYLQSCFKQKNGTPRQGNTAPNSRAKLTITYGTNPDHFLHGLEEYSHVWIVFVFHENTNKTTDSHNRPSVNAYVKPPRLNGQKRGVFATRTPHRPNPIGLSLCKLEKVEKSTIYLSGIDIIDGTPVIDIKPYIPGYDQLRPEDVRIPWWITDAPVAKLDVEFTEEALRNLEALVPTLAFFDSMESLKETIRQVLHQDPRSVYRRKRCTDELYGFGIDEVDLTCKFVEEDTGESSSSSTASSASASTAAQQVEANKGAKVIVLSAQHRSIREQEEKEQRQKQKQQRLD